jgi:RNA polymerase sigma-70 factor (ECF subfamily)
VHVSRSEQQGAVERFLVALRTGHVQELMEVMAPDVVLIADAGGPVVTAQAPISGCERVAKLLAARTEC